MQEFLTFKTFPDNETALDFAEVLKQQNINYFIEEDILVFDPSYANNPLNKDYAIKIMSGDFIRATKAYEDYFFTHLDQVDSDYYLFSFSVEELKDIIVKPDEWGSFDYQLAQKILKDKGLEVSEEQKLAYKTQRNKELAKPENESSSNVLLYYILSLLFFPLGMIAGWIWAYSKKTLPNGQRIYVYDTTVQRHGKRILTIATLLFILTIYWKIIGPYIHRF
ncbi:hypothetical protein [Flavisolibacter tropicus]|uniref:Uncharacterized protein n=1 Tax=Flavisolibacter tropicus TaxID=1492898 RepID=A0A172TXV0_9BACT|nr:hypothetical protein [Flavisolibacter tropicus]ANE51704.1 hypothetical protein SY85_15540 [Flavisolibacter tropicus]